MTWAATCGSGVRIGGTKRTGCCEGLLVVFRPHCSDFIKPRPSRARCAPQHQWLPLCPVCSVGLSGICRRQARPVDHDGWLCSRTAAGELEKRYGTCVGGGLDHFRRPLRRFPRLAHQPQRQCSGKVAPQHRTKGFERLKLRESDHGDYGLRVIDGKRVVIIFETQHGKVQTEELAVFELPKTLAQGEEFALQLTAVGDRLIGRFNDTILGPVTDQRLRDAGAIAVFGRSRSGTLES